MGRLYGITIEYKQDSNEVDKFHAEFIVDSSTGILRGRVAGRNQYLFGFANTSEISFFLMHKDEVGESFHGYDKVFRIRRNDERGTWGYADPLAQRIVPQGNFTATFQHINGLEVDENAIWKEYIDGQPDTLFGFDCSVEFFLPNLRSGNGDLHRK